MDSVASISIYNLLLLCCIILLVGSASGSCLLLTGLPNMRRRRQQIWNALNIKLYLRILFPNHMLYWHYFERTGFSIGKRLFLIWKGINLIKLGSYDNPLNQANKLHPKSRNFLKVHVHPFHWFKTRYNQINDVTDLYFSM